MSRILFDITILLVIVRLAAAEEESVPFTSSNLPILIITVDRAIPDSVRIPARLDVKFNADGSRNAVDQASVLSCRIAIEIRGSSSAWFEKKSYGFETQDENGENLNVPLLGFPKENDWILYGPYSDKSLLRNAITFHLARSMGRYASRTMFCELMINRAYQGLYLLMEKIKRDDNRVAIAPLTPAAPPEELSGGYIIKADKLEGTYRGWWTTSRPAVPSAAPIFLQYVYPKPDVITAEQEAFIRKYIYDFEAALNSAAFRDPQRGYLPFVDELSFVDMMIINELTKNIDAYRFSTFMYKDRGCPLTMGPIWDYNLGFGNVDYGNERAMFTDGWMYDQSGGRIYWWRRMMQNDRFKRFLSSRWHELRRGPFADARVVAVIDSMTTLINEARQRNFSRWKILGTYVWPNFFVGKTWEEEVDYMRGWLLDRMQWMDENMPYPPISLVKERSMPSLQPTAEPNPFRRHVTLTLPPSPQPAEVVFYDLLGREVARLPLAAAEGARVLLWNGKGGSGEVLPKGIYFFSVVESGTAVFRGKILKVE